MCVLSAHKTVISTQRQQYTPVSVLIHPMEMEILRSQTETEKTQSNRK